MKPASRSAMGPVSGVKFAMFTLERPPRRIIAPQTPALQTGVVPVQGAPSTHAVPPALHVSGCVALEHWLAPGVQMHVGHPLLLELMADAPPAPPPDDALELAGAPPTPLELVLLAMDVELELDVVVAEMLEVEPPVPAAGLETQPPKSDAPSAINAQ